jgi:hypothetical protein
MDDGNFYTPYQQVLHAAALAAIAARGPYGNAPITALVGG